MRCPDCPWMMRRPAPPPPPSYGGGALVGRTGAFGPGTIIPASVSVRLKSGIVELRPNTAVSQAEYDAGDPLRRARLALVACSPLGTAAGRLAAVRLFSIFLATVVFVPWAAVTPPLIADYVMWRAAPPTSVPQPPRGPVEPSTAMGDLVHLRAHAVAVSDPRLGGWYGACITSVLKRLGAGEKHDSVRKTPVQLCAVLQLVVAAEAPGAPLSVRLDAFLVTLGVLLFLRGSETAVTKECLVVDSRLAYIGIIFLRQKTRPGLASKRVTRVCSAPLLLRAYRTVQPYVTSLRPSDLVFPTPSDTTTANSVRSTLLRLLGTPPVMLGEMRPLPWSMRAGGATLCFHADMDIERLMRIGRWTSRVSLMYAVLTAQVQADIWTKALGQEDWYRDALPGSVASGDS